MKSAIMSHSNILVFCFPLLVLASTWVMIGCVPLSFYGAQLSINSQVSNQHVLNMSTNSIEMIINDTQTIQLILDPKLNSSQPNVFVRFDCEDDADSEKDFNWNSTKSNCRVMNLDSGFDYHFDSDVNSSPKNITISATSPGKQFLLAHWQKVEALSINDKKAYVSVNVGRSNSIMLISQILGWIYFVAWSVSFYPQIWDNFKRKSVVGLNFDYIALNITGFISYSIYNVALFMISSVQSQYEAAHPRSQIPVASNDVVFAIHACVATLVVILQCFFYERGEQTVSWFCKIFLLVVWLGYVVIAFVVTFSSLITMLSFLNILSYVKLTITIIKYIPQAWLNYTRKSTVGWSIGNILLDFTGGFLSMLQMLLLAYNYDDWETIFNNFTKFGLGLFSILFDILFILQHYVFYRHSENKSTSQTSLFTNINSTESGNDKKELSEKTKMESTLPNGSHTQYT